MFWLSFVMELDTLFFFLICFILCASATDFDREEALKKLDDDLKYVDPAKHVDFLKKKVADTLEVVVDTEKKLTEALVNTEKKLTEALIEVALGQKDQITYCEYVRDATCGQRFRFHMETFGYSQDVKKGDHVRQSNGLKKALGRINSAIQSTLDKITIHVKQLKILYRQLKGVSPNSVGFMNNNESIAWSDEVKKQFRIMQTVIRRNQPDEMLKPTYPRSLSDLIIEFNSAKDENEALTVFRNQCNRCFWSRESIGSDESSEIKKLVVRWLDEEVDSLITPKSGEEGVTIREEEFLKGTTATWDYFIRDSKTYNHCIDVFYFGKSNLEKLKETLKSKWRDEKDLAVLIEKFCSSFNHLYNLISNTNIHAPPRVPNQCKPNSTDYENYIKNIEEEPEAVQRYIIIAEVLGLIKSQQTND